MKTTAKLWLGLAVLAVVSPIGLFLPRMFKAGSAWGEWGTGEIRGLAGYLPAGMDKLSSVWNAVMPGYAIRGWEQMGPGPRSIAYIVSAIVGIAICVGAIWLIGKLLARKEK